MDIHPDAKAQIISVLKDDMEHIVVKNGMFIDRISAFLGFYRANNVLPKQGKLAQSLQAWIGDLPLIEFCSDSLSEKLTLYSQYIAGDDKRPLTEIEGYNDIGAVAAELLASFESLPWSYTLTLELDPNLFPPLPDDATSFAIGEETKLVKSALLMSEEYPLGSDDEAIEKRLRGPGILALLQDGSLNWNIEATYFQTRIEGFVGHYGGGSPLDVATSRLKAFLGLGLGMGLIDYESRYDPSPPKKEWIVHRMDHDKWAVRNKLSLDDDDVRLLQSLKPWDKFGLKYPQNQKVPWLQSVLEKMARAFSAATGVNPVTSDASRSAA